MPARSRFLAAPLAILLAMLVGCQGSRPVVVGSKNFTEQRVLGELIAQTVEAAGVPVERRLGLGDTLACDRALRKGDIDTYVEYTGTAFTAILKQKPVSDPAQVLPQVQAAYAADDLQWLRPLGFEDTFALVVRGEDATSHDLKTISDLAPLAPGWTVGLRLEFFKRPDGYEPLTAAYGLRFKDVQPIDQGSDLYGPLIDHRIDLAIGNATDGEIAHRKLVVLADDRHFFPPYQAVPVVRQQTLDNYPVLVEALNSLAGVLTPDVIRDLNWQVDGEKRDPADVVRAFRKSPAA